MTDRTPPSCGELTERTSILIVDDEIENLNLMIDVLSEHNFTIRVATDAGTALRQIEHHQPDLVILDILMPEENGFSLCSKLKANDKTTSIPVIFLSALSDQQSVIRGFACGAVDYITKPLRIEEILARVKTHAALCLARKQLQCQNEQLIRLHREKDIFLNTVVHDIKNALLNVVSFTYLLDDLTTVDPAKIHRTTGLFKDTIANLSALFSNLMIWSQCQLGVLRITPVEHTISQLLKNVLCLLDSDIKRKKITIEQLNEHADDGIVVDPDCFIIILKNLIANAIKFSHPDGTITIAWRRQEHLIAITVQDRGIGIPADRLHDLLMLGKRWTQRGVAGEKGTGIGLLVCQELAEKMNGSLAIASRVGAGTTVTLSLPVSS